METPRTKKVSQGLVCGDPSEKKDALNLFFQFLVMSIIRTTIEHSKGFIFSEGRLTHENNVVTNYYNKTASLFGGKVICGFCGWLILNSKNNLGKGVDVGKLIKQVEARTDLKVTSYEDFLREVHSVLLAHLQITQPRNTRNLTIHFLRQLDEKTFGFVYQRYDCNENGMCGCKYAEEIVSNRFYRPSGDDAAQDLIHKLSATTHISTDPDIIKGDDLMIHVNRLMIESASAVSGKIGDGITTNCGGHFFYSKIEQIY
jgi:hypothetical protein